MIGGSERKGMEGAGSGLNERRRGGDIMERERER